MKQTMLLKLAPSPEQHTALLDTMHAFNNACNAIVETAFAEQLANKFKLQKLVYVDIRKHFGLSSQLAIRAISKAADTYKRDKSIKPSFRREGAVTYDERLMSFKGLNEVSLLTLQGRVLVPFRIGGYQQARLDSIKGQADLLYRNGVFFLAVTLDVPAPTPDFPEGGTLGVDLGIVNLATDSEGETFSGVQLEQHRERLASLRQRLQKRGTKSAKRHLKKLSGREARFRKNTNHGISKRLVQKAKAHRQAIAIEDLRHTRSRTEVPLDRGNPYARYTGRSALVIARGRSGNFVSSFPISPLSQASHCTPLTHVTRLARVMCAVICAKENRTSQADFLCRQCGYAAHADYNAAINISRAAQSCSLLSRPVADLDNQVSA
jgi:putative transposase